MLMLRPRSASRTALVHCSAASRLSNTAAAVAVVSSPSMTFWKSGLLSRFQCASGYIDRDGRYAPPCRESPRFTGLNCSAISRNRCSLGTEFSSFFPRLAIAKTT